jgi:hypothetical protein
MKKRKFIGFMTVLSGLPGIAGITFFFMFGFSFSSMALLAIAAILFRGVAGTIGGILLWKGKRLGYQLSIVCHSYLMIAGVITLYQILIAGGEVSFAFTPENQFFLKALSRSIGKLIWGIPFIFILSRDLFNSKNVEDEINITPPNLPKENLA